MPQLPTACPGPGGKVGGGKSSLKRKGSTTGMRAGGKRPRGRGSSRGRGSRKKSNNFDDDDMDMEF